MADLSLHETGQGGDANILPNNDLELTNGLFNMVYLGLFGGNPAHITSENFLEGEQRFDWWGNSLFFNNQPDQQFNSYTENLLNTIALDSQARQKIIEFIKKDLDFLLKLATIEVDVVLTNNDTIEMVINVQELSKKENVEFQFIWDSTKSELIENRII